MRDILEEETDRGVCWHLKYDSKVADNSTHYHPKCAENSSFINPESHTSHRISKHSEKPWNSGDIVENGLFLPRNDCSGGDASAGCESWNLLFWLVAAWEDDFTGSVIDYGAYPDPQRPYFTLRDASRTLSTVIPGSRLEGAIYGGLDTLTNKLLGQAWLATRPC